jgi:hypothetical protein
VHPNGRNDGAKQAGLFAESCGLHSNLYQRRVEIAFTKVNVDRSLEATLIPCYKTMNAPLIIVNASDGVLLSEIKAWISVEAVQGFVVPTTDLGKSADSVTQG